MQALCISVKGPRFQPVWESGTLGPWCWETLHPYSWGVGTESLFFWNLFLLDRGHRPLPTIELGTSPSLTVPRTCKDLGHSLLKGAEFFEPSWVLLQVPGAYKDTNLTKNLNKQGLKRRTTIAIKGPRKGRNQVNFGFLSCQPDKGGDIAPTKIMKPLCLGRIFP